MAIVLYGKDGAKQVINGHVDFDAFERNGWFRKPDMVPVEALIEETDEEKEDQDLTDADTIRQLAKDEGIEKWDTKRIKTLKKELDLAE